MTTFRLLRQTNRSSRFVQVTVDVEPSVEPGVDVTAAIAAEFRREADLGARWALRNAATAVKVTVTDVVTSTVDTGAADVYEATAHAVWQALGVTPQVPYVGFGDPAMVVSWLTEMVGRRLDAVTEARSWHQGRCEPDAAGLLHAWLYFAHAMPVGLHGRGDQLLLAKEDPYPSYDDDRSRGARVGPAQPPDVLSTFVGARLIDGAVIVGHDGDQVCAGMALRFDDDDLVIGSLADEWAIAVGVEPSAVTSDWTRQPFVRGTSR